MPEHTNWNWNIT